LSIGPRRDRLVAAENPLETSRCASTIVSGFYGTNASNNLAAGLFVAREIS
jgi:hypothetical protein